MAPTQTQHYCFFVLFFYVCQFLNYPLRLFTFMPLADTFIWRILHCIQNVHFYQLTHDIDVVSAMLYSLSFKAHKTNAFPSF